MIDRFFESVFNWLDGILPIQCADCKKWVSKRDTALRFTLTGMIVRLCPKCNKKWFGGEDEDSL